ncbi:MAG: hypothetical protein ACYCXQ_08645 [Candidatus Humimicrobiaceae bacterium]
MKEFKVFISHGADTKDICQLTKDVIKEESNNHFKNQGYLVHSFCWDDNDITRGIGDPQEDIIDPLLIKCDLIIMVLGLKLGSPTKRFSSGIEHEYEIIKKNKINMLIFFKNFLILPFSLDPNELLRVHNFKKRIEEERVYTHCGFVENPQDYSIKLRSQVGENIKKIISEKEIYPNIFSQLSRGF